MNYNGFRKMARNLINEFGAPFTLLKKALDTPLDPETLKPSRTWNEFSGIAVKQAYEVQGIGKQSVITHSGEVNFICVLDDTSIEPREKIDRIRFDNIEYTILSVTIISPSGGDAIVYSCATRMVGKNE